MASTIQVDKIQDTGGNTILSSNSTGTFTYAAASGANFTNLSGVGKILQVVSQNIGTTVTNNTSTYADTGVTVDITPSATSSKILVIATINGVVKVSGNSGTGFIGILLRDASTLSLAYSGHNGVSDNVYMSTVTYGYVDSPSSTSALTYKVQFKNNYNGAGVKVNSDSADSSIVCMEIGA